MTEKVYLVFVAGLRGPAPQIWHGLRVDPSGKPKPTLIEPIELEGYELGCNLGDLANTEKFKNALRRVQTPN